MKPQDILRTLNLYRYPEFSETCADLDRAIDRHTSRLRRWLVVRALNPDCRVCIHAEVASIRALRDCRRVFT